MKDVKISINFGSFPSQMKLARPSCQLFVYYTGSQNDGTQNQKLIRASFDLYISKYLLIIMHIILKWQRTSKVFKNVWKLITLVWGWVNHYKQVSKKLIYSDKNKPKQTKLASKCIFSEIKKTLVLSHFKIMCIIINIYFDLLIKRRSNPLLVLSVFKFRADIMNRPLRK